MRYHEWDAAIQDYRMNWSRVLEREAAEGASEFVEETLAAQRGPVRLLRRYFESLRPPGLRRMPGQVDGEDLDMDALVGRLADLKAGMEPSERMYVRREKRDREVAAAFLVDLSGSTSRQVEQGRRIIDIEKQGLVLLCEALTAIGDQFAVYGYSGQGRHQVDFVVIKGFDEPVTGRAGAKLGGIVPLQQNRDGAAIRHAANHAGPPSERDYWSSSATDARWMTDIKMSMRWKTPAWRCGKPGPTVSSRSVSRSTSRRTPMCGAAAGHCPICGH
ncbi:MAG: hypothetical protein MRJ92_06910 [Nitrospira sp.]|nr:hypothetical protein [Nitrospira sp.]